MAAIGSGAATHGGVACCITYRSTAGGRPSTSATAPALPSAMTAAAAASARSIGAGCLFSLPCTSDDVGRSLVFRDYKAEFRETRAALFAVERVPGEAVAADFWVSVHLVDEVPSRGLRWRKERRHGWIGGRRRRWRGRRRSGSWRGVTRDSAGIGGWHTWL